MENTATVIKLLATCSRDGKLNRSGEKVSELVTGLDNLRRDSSRREARMSTLTTLICYDGDRSRLEVANLIQAILISHPGDAHEVIQLATVEFNRIERTGERESYAIFDVVQPFVIGFLEAFWTVDEKASEYIAELGKFLTSAAGFQTSYLFNSKEYGRLSSGAASFVSHVAWLQRKHGTINLLSPLFTTLETLRECTEDFRLNATLGAIVNQLSLYAFLRSTLKQRLQYPQNNLIVLEYGQRGGLSVPREGE